MATQMGARKYKVAMRGLVRAIAPGHHWQRATTSIPQENRRTNASVSRYEAAECPGEDVVMPRIPVAHASYRTVARDRDAVKDTSGREKTPS